MYGHEERSDQGPEAHEDEVRRRAAELAAVEHHHREAGKAVVDADLQADGVDARRSGFGDRSEGLGAHEESSEMTVTTPVATSGV